MSLRTTVVGAGGRMGQALVRAIAGDPRLTLAAAIERRGSPLLGRDAGQLAGLTPNGVAISEFSTAAHADAVIVFTTPDAVAPLCADLAAAPPRALIIGATGLDAAAQGALDAIAARSAVVQTGNFSLGVNLLEALVETAAQRLGVDWDIEVVEAHHRRKIDAPSGTALMLGRAAARGRGVAFEAARLQPRDGVTGPRPEGGIGFAVVRGGGIVGEHDVIFASEHETLKLSHVAGDRSQFAEGALAAARWAAAQPPGRYDMRAVLGF